MIIYTISELQKQYPSLLNFKRPLKEKKIDAALDLLNIITSDCDWESDLGDRRVVQLFISKIKASRLLNQDNRTFFTFLKKRFKEIVRWNEAKAAGETRTALPAPITTAKITGKAEIDVVVRICQSWQKMMRPLEDITDTVASDVSEEERGLICDSAGVIDDFIEALSVPLKKSARIYVAFTENRLEGITIRKKNKIELLCTNPNNLPLYGLTTACTRGAGTALITHVAQKILSKESLTEKRIDLTSLDSARSFYEKLGFKENSILTSHFSLDAGRCAALVRKKPNTHTMGSCSIEQLQNLTAS